VKIVFPKPKDDVLSKKEMEEIFKLIIEALKNIIKKHRINGYVMEEYELPETAKKTLNCFKKFTNQPKQQQFFHIKLSQTLLEPSSVFGLLK
jgi:ribonucleotide reductase beta subunit family protein with ferritin-like domain